MKKRVVKNVKKGDKDLEVNVNQGVKDKKKEAVKDLASKKMAVKDLEANVNPRPQVIVDISKVPADHHIIIPLWQLKRNYPNLIQEIIKICTRGGTKVYGKHSTFYHSRDLGFIVQFKDNYLGTKVFPSFFFLKKDIYVVGLCKSKNNRVGSNWICARGSDVIIEGSGYAQFSIDYGKLEKCEGGFHVIQQALYNLIISDIGNGENFLKVAHHISEAVRNIGIQETISKSFQMGVDLPLNTFHFHHWKSYSALWRINFFSLDSEQKKKRYIERFDLLHIKNIDYLGQILQILLMENEEERRNRRSNALELYLPSSVSPDNIVKKCMKVAKHNLQVDDELELFRYREKELNKLMKEGGDRDMWICIKDALREPDLEYTKLKIQHTDLFVKKSNLSECQDDRGYIYVIKDDRLLSEVLYH